MKNITPLVSVIIPVYNVEKYLAQCLNSIINQTYSNLEIMIINDGSSDNSSFIAEDFATKDTRIKVFHFSNSGVSVARNRGIKIAKGEYISFVDSDDWLHNEFYEKMVHLLIKYDLDMVKCSAIETDNDKRRHLLLPEQSQVYKILGSNDSSKNLKYYFEGVLWIVPWNGLYKSDLVKQNLFLEKLYFEDNYSAAMFLYASRTFMIIDDTLYFYRINLSGISKSKTYRLLDIAFVTLKLIKDLKDKGCDDQKIYFKLYSKFAKEIFHFIRDCDSSHFRVISIKNTMYKFICNHLNFRRKYFFKFLIIKRRIKIF